MLCNNGPLKVQQFRHNFLSTKIPGVVSSLNLLKTPSRFREYLLFFYGLKTIEYLISFFNSNAFSRVAIITFTVLMMSPTAN